MSLTINTAKMEGDVVSVIKAWATFFPAELVAFDCQMKNLREHKLRKNGSAPGVSTRHFGEIPVKLNFLMTRRFGTSWCFDRKLRNFFWQNFIVGKIDRGATLSFHSGEKTV